MKNVMNRQQLLSTISTVYKSIYDKCFTESTRDYTEYDLRCLLESLYDSAPVDSFT